MSTELAIAYLEHWGGHAVSAVTSPFIKGDAMDVIELLWVLTPLFSGDDRAPFRETKYDPHFETEVDLLLEAAAETFPMHIEIESVEQGRVLYERFQQAIKVIGANAAENRPLLIPRKSYLLPLRQSATVLLWLHEMTLPFDPGTVRPSGAALQ